MPKTKDKRTFLDRIAKDKEGESKITVQNENPPQEPAKEGEGEEWFSDYEGQLTVDVYQTDNDLVIKSTIAGVKPEDIDVSLNNDMLTIKGERKKNDEVKEDDYYYQECYWGAFSRSIILPVEVDADKIQAKIKDGILTVTLPKSKKAKTKNIEVQAE